MKDVLVSSNKNKIVPSLAIVLVVLFSFSALMVSQPVTNALYEDEGNTPPFPFLVYRNFSSPAIVSRGGSVTLSARIDSGVNETIDIILTLGETYRDALSWESQYVEIPPYGSAYNNITIRVSENAPLGGFPLVGITGEGYGSVTSCWFGLRVVEDNNWGLVTLFTVAGSQRA